MQSVIEQTYQNWECIIVNDGSPDNTKEIAKKWVEKDNRFKYLDKDNGGLSSARNSGIKISKGEYILPLDADDKISNNYIEVCLNEFIKNPVIKLVYGKAIKFGVVNSDWNLPNYNYDNLLNGNMIYCSAIYKKSVWEISGGYDEQMKLGFEDWEFWIRILNKDSKVIKREDIIFYYRIKENSMNIVLTNNIRLKKEIKEYIYLKYREKYTLLSDYELYNENRILTNKLEYIYIYVNYRSLFKSILKKVCYKIKKWRK